MAPVPQRAMARYLRTLQTHPGPGLPPLPLAECAGALGLDGLAFLLAPEGRVPELLQSHGGRTAALEDLQRTQGQGPTPEAAGTHRMVLVPDLAATDAARWPALSPALAGLGVHAVFAFPLSIGVITLGVLTGHRTTPGPMSAPRLTEALVLVGTLSSILVDLAARPDDAAVRLLDEPGLHFAEVHQATGMLAAQLGIPPSQALVRLRAHAFSHDLPLLATARAVLSHRLRLATGDDGDRP